MNWAKKQRKNMTYTEQLVWKELQELNHVLPEGIFWQRQLIVGNYIVDFVCKKAALGLEVDGVSHTNKVSYDNYRQYLLNQAGWKIMHLGEDVFKPAALYAFISDLKVETLRRLNKYDR
jgi:very-short-patch-repair endonuclease